MSFVFIQLFGSWLNPNVTWFLITKGLNSAAACYHVFMGLAGEGLPHFLPPEAALWSTYSRLGRVGPMMRQTLGLSSSSLSYNIEEEKLVN